MSGNYCTQNTLLLNNLMKFYNMDENLEKILPIINGESEISLRLIDWFVTNFAKKNFTVYNKSDKERFKVYIDYKLKLKAYSKKRFDPFCRWDRINIPYKDDTFIQTTLGQLNFFRWALENETFSSTAPASTIFVNDFCDYYDIEDLDYEWLTMCKDSYKLFV